MEELIKQKNSCPISHLISGEPKNFYGRNSPQEPEIKRKPEFRKIRASKMATRIVNSGSGYDML